MDHDLLMCHGAYFRCAGVGGSMSAELTNINDRPARDGLRLRWLPSADDFCGWLGVG